MYDEPVHDGLEYGGEWCDPYPRPDEDGVLGPVDVAGGGTKRSVDKHLNDPIDDSDKKKRKIYLTMKMIHIE